VSRSDAQRIEHAAERTISSQRDRLNVRRDLV
jgi:hypothetical protein